MTEPIQYCKVINLLLNKFILKIKKKELIMEGDTRLVRILKVTQSCPTLCDPMDYTVNGILQARISEWVAFLFSRGSSQPRIEPRSPALQVDSLPAEPQEKIKNIGVISLSLP